jgi:HlyD family secretion protein
VADHDLQMAQAALGRIGGQRHGRQDELALTSPIKGRVLRVIQQSEGAVQLGAPLLELGDSGALEVVVDVLTSDAVNVQPGARAWIERWGGEHALASHVRLVEPSAVTRVSALGVEEQRVNVVIDLDEPHAVWAALGDGYRVEARIATWQGQDVLSVAASAVFRRQADWAVFKVENGIARVVKIEVGHRNADRVEIKRGLRAGEQVIAHPSERLADGTRVEPR